MPASSRLFRMGYGVMEGVGEGTDWKRHGEPVLNTSEIVSLNSVLGPFEEGLTGNGTRSLECRKDPFGLRGSCCNHSGET